ncbi:MAG: 4-alpha-glucanotransferase [Deltaproteobacteria bacterium]|nr:4-alpha-glucanotransferase [Deltaproteobacteria bacterium]
MPQRQRSAGILLHPTSLPGPYGIGDVGPAAFAFVDWLEEAGVTSWQMLPLVPPGPGGSPYSSPSALASNPMLISLQGLVDEGWLNAREVEAIRVSKNETSKDSVVDFDKVHNRKMPALKRAATNYAAKNESALREVLEQKGWRRAHALFVALKIVNDDTPWWTWPQEQRSQTFLDSEQNTWPENLLRHALHELALQSLFDEQWNKLRAHAKKVGVSLIGDVPIYVDLDSANVWSEQHYFQLDDEHRPLAVAGVPPDAFSDVGQLWGNPLYNCDVMKADDHAFWVRRMERMLEQVDCVRIDHFRAFAAYWRVPYGAEDARNGMWVPGPGPALFDDLKNVLGVLPIIAEDLGIITPDVEKLRDDVELPGMKIMQFAFGEGDDHMYLPHNHIVHSVAYTGTHDNDTLLGWWTNTDEHIRDHVRRYLSINGDDVVWDVIRSCFSSRAYLAVAPLQDVLCLGDEARMNIPGRAFGNWGWRVQANAFGDDVTERLRKVVEQSNRKEDSNAK